MDCIFPTQVAPLASQACKQCGIIKSLDCYSFVKRDGKHRTTCRDCRAAWLRAYRRDPAHIERRREKERARSASRRPAIRAWERAHPANLRPGRQRRQARRDARLRAARLAAQFVASIAAAATRAASH